MPTPDLDFAELAFRIDKLEYQLFWARRDLDFLLGHTPKAVQDQLLAQRVVHGDNVITYDHKDNVFLVNGVAMSQAIIVGVLEKDAPELVQAVYRLAVPKRV
jgi:hypothetical protein